MSHLDELHARFEAVMERGRATEQRYRDVMARHEEQQRENAAEAKAMEGLIHGLVAVTAAVASADNSDSSVCYQVCQYRTEGEDMRLVHTGPCVVELARAVIAASQGLSDGD